MHIVNIINSAEAGGAQALICNWEGESEYKNRIILIVLQNTGFFSKHYETIFEEVFYLNVSLNPICLLKSLLKIWKICREFRADIIHTHLLQSDLVGIILSKFGFKVVTTIHSSSLIAERHKRSEYLQRYIARVSDSFSQIISSSRASTSFATELGYPASKIWEIRNCTPKSKFDISFGRPQNYFLSLARWHPVKDHLTLLKGFKLHTQSHPRSKLFLSGFGIDQRNQSLMEILNQLDLHESVKIFDEPQDSRYLIKDALATVISSKSESVSMVAIESLAEGTPVISSRVGDFKDIILHPLLAFDAGDYTELAQAMNFLVCMEEFQYSNLQNQALNRYTEQFSADKWIANHLHVYSLLTEGPTTGTN